MNLPLVTVIIPTYNRADLLPRAVSSVLNQTYAALELLIVDDGSTDGTAEVVKRFQDPRVRFLRLDQNQGQCAAMNAGIEAARGDWVCFLDSDDEYLETCIERQMTVFQTRGSEALGVVYVLSGERTPDGRVIPAHFNALEGDVYAGALTQGYVAPSITLLIRKTCFDQVGYWDTQFRCFQDDDLCIRLAKQYQFEVVREVLAVVHRGAVGQLTRNRSQYAGGWYQLIHKHEREILRVVGRAVLAKHYVRAIKLFADARDRKRALHAARCAFQAAGSIWALGRIAGRLTGESLRKRYTIWKVRRS